MLKRFALTMAAVSVVSLVLAAPVLAVPSSGFYAFGSNLRGQLGSTANLGTFDPAPPSPSLPGATGGVVQVSGGNVHSLALTSTGQVFAFGSNRSGQLGISTNVETEAPNPFPALVSLPGATGPAIQIATGSNHSLALTSTGQVFAFGANGSGQLGNNGTSNANPFPALVSLPGATGQATQIAAGSNFSLVLTSTGQVWAFGSNRYGELGNTTNNGSESPNSKPVQIAFAGATGPVTQIAAGAYFTLALTSTGQLYGLGRNNHGELGNSTNAETEVANPVATLASLTGVNGQVTQIAAGFEHSLLLTSTGQVYTFGCNRVGQLGRAAGSGTFGAFPKPTLIALPGATGAVTHLAGGSNHSLVATSTGQVYAFGENSFGQLGITANLETGTPNPTPTLVPLTIPAGTSVADVAAGPATNHSLVALVAAPPAPEPPAGARPRASAAKQALVKNGKAMVSLSCPGSTACSGKLVLKAKLKAGKKKSPARASAKKKPPKPVQIGAARFSVPAGKKRTIAVPLKPKALARVKAAGQAGLRAQLSGQGVKPGTVALKAAAKPHRR